MVREWQRQLAQFFKRCKGSLVQDRLWCSAGSDLNPVYVDLYNFHKVACDSRLHCDNMFKSVETNTFLSTSHMADLIDFQVSPGDGSMEKCLVLDRSIRPAVLRAAECNDDLHESVCALATCIVDIGTCNFYPSSCDI